MSSVRSLLALSAVFLSTGCAIHPEPEDVTVPDTTLDIVQRIRCEARAAVLGLPAEFSDRAEKLHIAYQFTFKIVEKNDLTAVSGKFTDPLQDDTFTLGINGSSTRHRTTERKFLFEDSFAELKRLDQTVDCPSETPHGRWLYPVTGGIGMKEVIHTYFALPSPSGFNDTIAFTTRFYGSVKPTITLTPITTSFHPTSGTGTLMADRSDMHKVSISIDQTAAGAAKTLQAETDLVTQQQILELLEE